MEKGKIYKIVRDGKGNEDNLVPIKGCADSLTRQSHRLRKENKMTNIVTGKQA